MIKLYEGLDINKLEFLGSGTQGKVYRINSEKCIKVMLKGLKELVYKEQFLNHVKIARPDLYNKWLL